MAYQEMRDRFPLWARLPVQDAPVAAARASPPEVELARPLPPPPND